jgi:hypothetical protein
MCRVRTEPLDGATDGVCARTLPTLRGLRIMNLNMAPRDHSPPAFLKHTQGASKTWNKKIISTNSTKTTGRASAVGAKSAASRPVRIDSACQLRRPPTRAGKTPHRHLRYPTALFSFFIFLQTLQPASGGRDLLRDMYPGADQDPKDSRRSEAMRSDEMTVSLAHSLPPGRREEEDGVQTVRDGASRRR